MLLITSETARGSATPTTSALSLTRTEPEHREENTGSIIVPEGYNSTAKNSSATRPKD